jgi:hypothetical protein
MTIFKLPYAAVSNFLVDLFKIKWLEIACAIGGQCVRIEHDNIYMHVYMFINLNIVGRNEHFHDDQPHTRAGSIAKLDAENRTIQC